MLLAWCGGYALAALGMLTKGAAPVYFVAGVGLFLVLTRRWRELFTWQHAAGIAVFLAIWLAWEIPFCLRVTPHQAWLMLTGDTTGRFEDTNLLKIGKHFIEFPLSVAACLLPWGVLLLAYSRRDFRRGIEFAQSEVLFLGGVDRFCLPHLLRGARAEPVFRADAAAGRTVDRSGRAAVLGGMEQGAGSREQGQSPLPALSLAAGLFPICRHPVRRTGHLVRDRDRAATGAFRGQQPPAFALVFALAAAAAAAIAVATSGVTAARKRKASFNPKPTAMVPHAVAVGSGLNERRSQPVEGWLAQERLGVLALAAFLGLTYSGAIINVFVATWHPIGDEVAAATVGIPEGVELGKHRPGEPRVSLLLRAANPGLAVRTRAWGANLASGHGSA